MLVIQVPQPENQCQVMIEAVENHMPEVIVIDEIGTEAECQAARTIAQRGVQLVATAHGEFNIVLTFLSFFLTSFHLRILSYVGTI